MNKRALLEAIIAKLTVDLELLTKAALATHAEATAEENKSENKYDTRGLEASYLADGQSKVADEAAHALAQFRALVASETPAGAPIDLGALVTLADDTGKHSHYFVGPRAGGTEIAHERATIMVITPSSPLGRQLVGKRPGDTVQLEFGRRRSAFRVVRVD